VGSRALDGFAGEPVAVQAQRRGLAAGFVRTGCGPREVRRQEQAPSSMLNPSRPAILTTMGRRNSFPADRLLS
jgi:hypothetical protein